MMTKLPTLPAIPRLVRKYQRFQLLVGLIVLIFVSLLLLNFSDEQDGEKQSSLRVISQKLKSYTYPSKPKSLAPVEPQRRILPHYHAEGMIMSPHTCGLHGRPVRDIREKSRNLRLIDAIFLDEDNLDILEIRMAETQVSVDRFFIVESNMTYDGRPRELLAPKKLDRFHLWHKKIEYRFVPNFPDPTKTPEMVKQERLEAMDRLMRSHLHELKPELKVIVLTSHVSQIPAQHTLKLLRHCVLPSSMYLQYKSFLYSFEYYLGIESSQSTVRTYTGGGRLLPSDQDTDAEPGSPDLMLGDAGWHCQYCFRHISTYVSSLLTHRMGSGLAIRNAGEKSKSGKGKEVSEEEALRVQEREIQDALCHGKDMFDVEKAGIIPHSSAVFVPKTLLDKIDNYKFLVPGNCIREKPQSESKENETS